MSESKYICGTIGDSYLTEAIIFANTITHADMAKRMRMDVLGAGFVDLNTKHYGDGEHGVEANVYGRSESLNIDSRGEEDLRDIRRSLGLV